MTTYFPESQTARKPVFTMKNAMYFAVSVSLFLLADYCLSGSSSQHAQDDKKYYSVTPQAKANESAPKIAALLSQNATQETSSKPALDTSTSSAGRHTGKIGAADKQNNSSNVSDSVNQSAHTNSHASVRSASVTSGVLNGNSIEPGVKIKKNELPGYQISTKENDFIHSVMPELPDISQYTYDNVISRKNDWMRREQGDVVVDKMFDSDVLHDFTAGERATEWAKRQTSFPKAIYIRDGFVTLEQMAEALQDTPYFEKQENHCIIRLPLVVEHSGALDLENDYCQQVRFSQDRGSFLAVSGVLFVLDTELIAWNEEHQKSALFKNKKEFRPFLVTWTGSELYIANSTITSFGYHKSKSYGLSVANYSESILHKWEEKNPIAWIIDSTFIDMYYGFYCYDSDNLVVLRNTYIDNVVYGIDPHDYSNNLIIAYNEVSGTKLKHGIIVSREVSNSWIFNNKSYDNKLSGFVLDRKSSNNVVANNVSLNNGSDGITFYESDDNLVYNNEVMGNRKHGIRARNSTNIHLQNNKVVANGGYGVYGHVKNLDATPRDFKLDPYTYAVSMTLNGDILAANDSGAVHIDKQNSIAMRDLELRFSKSGYQTYFGGSLESFHNQIIEALLLEKKVAVVRAVDNGGNI